jgi:Zn-dependent peptidase ImmA (M78 family)
MTTVDEQLLDFAGEIGVRVDYGRLLRDQDGVWVPKLQLIRIRPGLHARLHRCVLAHELGHAVHGDSPNPFGLTPDYQERRAETWAARRLINPDDYRHAETECEGHPGAMAVELGVMRSTVTAYQALLLRAEDCTYIAPRMGTGQWTARIPAAA